jgi:hypothetical protein
MTPLANSQIVGGRRLFDLNPVQRAPDGHHYQRTPVAAEVGGISLGQLKAVVAPRKRELLARAFEKHGITGNKTLPRAALQGLPFTSVRLKKPDCTDTNVRRIPSGHRFKLSNSGGTRVNEAAVIYRTTAGKLASYVVKNRLAFGPTPTPGDFEREVWRARPGDDILDAEGKTLGSVTKIGSNGSLTLDTGKSRMAHGCRKGGI